MKKLFSQMMTLIALLTTLTTSAHAQTAATVVSNTSNAVVGAQVYVEPSLTGAGIGTGGQALTNQTINLGGGRPPVQAFFVGGPAQASGGNIFVPATGMSSMAVGSNELIAFCGKSGGTTLRRGDPLPTAAAPVLGESGSTNVSMTPMRAYSRLASKQTVPVPVVALSGSLPAGQKIICLATVLVRATSQERGNVPMATLQSDAQRFVLDVLQWPTEVFVMTEKSLWGANSGVTSIGDSKQVGIGGSGTLNPFTYLLGVTAGIGGSNMAAFDSSDIVVSMLVYAVVDGDQPEAAQYGVMVPPAPAAAVASPAPAPAAAPASAAAARR